MSWHRFTPISIFPGFAFLGLMTHLPYLGGVDTHSTSPSRGLAPGDLPEGYVIGGEDAAWGEYPWMGALVLNNDSNTSQFCGCTAIDRYWILTAAHCMDDGTEPDDFKVLFGPGLLGNDPSIESFKADAIVLHPNYSSIYGLEYDVALVKLKTPLPESFPILPLISDPDLEQTGNAARIVGWGYTNYDFRNFMDPEFLQEGDVRIISRLVANSGQFFGGYFTSNMLAAGSLDPYRAANFGDSGGPLLGFNAELDRWEQIGVVSFGAGCTKPSNPIGGFTRISRFLPWIDGIISNDFFSWMRGNGIDAFDQDDGDDNAPLMEYILGLDPTEPDAVNWYPQLKADQETGDREILLPVRLRQEIPRLGFHFEKSLELNAWDRLELSWDQFVRKQFPETGEILYQIPLVSKTSPEGFYRLTHQDFSGILYGPYPLRVGSTAFGQFNHELEAKGITRYDYLIDNLGLLEEIRLTVVSDVESPLRLRVVDLETGEVQLDREGDATTETTPSPVAGSLAPEPGKQYLARVESTQHTHPQNFKINADLGGEKVVINPGSTKDGSLSPTDNHYKRPNHFADTYQVQLQAETTYRIVVRTEEFDPILFVQDITTLEPIQEVDERPPGKPEEVLIRTGAAPNVELTVSSWRPKEMGDYSIEVNAHTEPDFLHLGEETIGFINSSDAMVETFFLDSIILNLGDTRTPVTVYVEGFGNFLPTFGVLNITDQEVLSSQRAFCEDRYFTFTPEEGKIYAVRVIARRSSLGENYHLGLFQESSTPVDLSNVSTKPHWDRLPPSAESIDFDWETYLPSN